METQNEDRRRITQAAYKVDKLEERVRDIEVEMAQHEAQCEERWKTTFNRLEDIDGGVTRINSKLMIALGSVIVFLGGVVVTLATGGF